MTTFSTPIALKTDLVSRLASKAEAVLYDYSYEPIEFYDPMDEPQRRLLATKGLKFLYKMVTGKRSKGMDTTVMVEAICAAHWYRVEILERKEMRNER